MSIDKSPEAERQPLCNGNMFCQVAVFTPIKAEWIHSLSHISAMSAPQNEGSSNNHLHNQGNAAAMEPVPEERSPEMRPRSLSLLAKKKEDVQDILEEMEIILPVEIRTPISCGCTRHLESIDIDTTVMTSVKNVFETLFGSKSDEFWMEMNQLRNESGRPVVSLISPYRTKRPIME